MENEFIKAANKSYENSKKLDRLRKNKGYQRSKELRSIGFASAGQNGNYNKLETEMKVEETEINLVKYYRKTYGAFKFVLAKDFNDICNKHRFTFIKIADYTGFVSDETISKIKKIPRIKKSDLRCFAVKEGRGENKDKFVAPNFDISIVSDSDIEYLKRNYNYKYLCNIFSEYGEHVTGEDGGAFGEKEYCNHSAYSQLHYIDYEKEGLQICGRSRPENYGEIYLNQDIPMPIIFQQVRGGYVIVSEMKKEIEHSVLEYRRNGLKQFHLVQGDGFNFPGYEDKYIYGELYKAIENEDVILEKKIREYIEINSLELDVSKLTKFELDEC